MTNERVELNLLNSNYNLLLQPYLNYANTYYDLGLQPISCKDKITSTRWKKWQTERLPEKEFKEYLRDFPDGNIALITGSFCNLTVVDSDEVKLSIDDLQNEFGETNFIVKTPRGGYHLYYSNNNEKPKNRFDKERKIDIKSEGCVIIAPFSHSKKHNEYYRIVKGSLSDIRKGHNLPYIKKPLEQRADFNKIKDGKKTLKKKGKIIEDGKIEEGRRNNELYNYLKDTAVKSCRSFEALKQRAYDFNNFNNMKELLPEEEIIETAKSIWGYKLKGTLYTKGRSEKKEVLSLVSNPTAYLLLAFLRVEHDGIRKEFNIYQEAVAKTLKKDKQTIRKAIEFLLEKKFLSRRTTTTTKLYKGKEQIISPYIYKFI